MWNEEESYKASWTGTAGEIKIINAKTRDNDMPGKFGDWTDKEESCLWSSFFELWTNQVSANLSINFGVSR